MDKIFGIKMNIACDQQQSINVNWNFLGKLIFHYQHSTDSWCYNVKLKQPPIVFIVPNLVCKTFILIIVKSTNATESINFSNLLLKKKTCRTLAMKFRKKPLIYTGCLSGFTFQICKTYAKHTLTIFFRTLLNSG